MRSVLRRLLLPFASALLIGDVVFVGYRALRGRVPWTQIFFPLIVAFELLRLHGGAQSPTSVVLVLVLAELTLLTAAILLLRKSESAHALRSRDVWRQELRFSCPRR